MMNCQQIRSKVHDYHDNVLVSPTHHEIDQHIATCDECGIFYHQHQRLHSLLSGMPRSSATESLKQKIKDGHNSKAKPLTSSKNILSTLLLTQKYASAASIAIIAVVLGFLFFPSNNNISSPPLTESAITESLLTESSSTKVVTQVNQPNMVNFLVNAEHAIDHVTFSLVAPDDMELYGYPGQHTLSWDGKLKQGHNLLSIALMPNKVQTGTLIITISHKNKLKQYKVFVDATTNSTKNTTNTNSRLLS